MQTLVFAFIYNIHYIHERPSKGAPSCLPDCPFQVANLEVSHNTVARLNVEELFHADVSPKPRLRHHKAVLHEVSNVTILFHQPILGETRRGGRPANGGAADARGSLE